jgi:hypothetical protein
MRHTDLMRWAFLLLIPIAALTPAPPQYVEPGYVSPPYLMPPVLKRSDHNFPIERERRRR